MKRRFVLGLGLIVLVLGVLSGIRISGLVSAADPDDGVSARDLSGAEPQAGGVGFAVVYEPGSPSPISLATSLYSDGSNIGVGTAAPGARLHVVEGGWILGSSDGPPVFGVSGWLTSDAGNLIEGGGGDWANHFSAYGSGDIARFGTSTGPGQEPDTKVVITNGGNVGIGMETPQGRLHVAEGDWIVGSSDGPPGFGVSGWLTSYAGNLIEGGGGAWANHFSAYGGGDIARFGTSTGPGQEPDTKVVITNGGNVGIGMETPQGRLHVAEGDWIVGSSDGPPGFGVSGWLTSYAGNLIEGGGGAWANHFSAYGGGDIARFGTSTGPGQEPDTKVVITNDGLVGIGTAEPAFPLDVNGQARVSRLQVAETDWILGSSQDFPGFGVSGWLTSYAGNLIEGGGGDWANHFSAYGGGDIARFGTSTGSGQDPDTKVVIRNNGRVGIGTTGPVAPLHVQQDAGVGAGFHTLAAFDRLGGFGGGERRGFDRLPL